MTNQAPVITVDGPSGAGKGTLCMLLANKLGWNILDSGAIYRVLALSAIKNAIDLNNETALAQAAANLDVKFVANGELVSVILQGEDVSSELRQEKTGMVASKVAAYSKVRAALLQRQKAFAVAPGLVADGRDMGTVVFPDAPVKIFLDASAQERANRRFIQLQQKGLDVSLSSLLQEIEQRDHQDRNRPVAPLRPADDAIVLDSTSLSIVQVLEQVLDYVEKKLK